MDILNDIELLDCPVCHGPGLLEADHGWCMNVTCLDCGTHTADIPFDTEEEKFDAAHRAARLWNIGKVIAAGPGE